MTDKENLWFQILQALYENPDLTGYDIVKVSQKWGEGVLVGTLYKGLTALDELGYISRNGEGKRATWRISEKGEDFLKALWKRVEIESRALVATTFLARSYTVHWLNLIWGIVFFVLALFVPWYFNESLGEFVYFLLMFISFVCILRVPQKLHSGEYTTTSGKYYKLWLGATVSAVAAFLLSMLFAVLCSIIVF
ncbi:MAG: PadR family transcriptional regulator [Patescibacteria group bacterium]